MKEKSAEDIEFEAFQIVSNYVMSLRPKETDFSGLPYQERVEGLIARAIENSEIA